MLNTLQTLDFVELRRPLVKAGRTTGNPSPEVAGTCTWEKDGVGNQNKREITPSEDCMEPI